ncbi:MAG: hypothetical protein CM15mV31_0480 [uncultured marine virus]|nr:MAG: hypothetical protein CM15mV31_0480 [uncultured marine virus]
MRVDKDGRVKIGTTSNTPAASDVAGIVFGDNTAGTAKVGVASFCADGAAPLLLTRLTSDGNILGIADDNGTKALLRVNSNDFEVTAIEDLRLATGSGHTERIRLTNAGNLGIGTTSPSTTLHINAAGSSTQMRIENSNADFLIQLVMQAMMVFIFTI